MKKILIVDDDRSLVTLVSLNMRIAGYEVLTATDGEKALEMAEKEKPDVIILDIMLPKINGWQICRYLREESLIKNVPIIILSACTELEDKIKGFELGADDYVTKPFSPRELICRVKNFLNRIDKVPKKSKFYIKDRVEIDLDEFKVKVEGKEIELTKRERDILKILLSNPGKVLTYEQILDHVWKDDIVEYGNIDVHIHNLRRKIEKDYQSPQIIKTIKGMGYQIEY